MARATRSKPKPKEPTPEPAVSTVKPLPASTSNPPKLFVLPKDTSNDARIVTLDNPANETPSRYFFCPTKGFYEFTRIQAPKKECRSWLIAGERTEGQEEEAKEGSIGSGYVTKSADMFIATPIDLLFLILPALSPAASKDTKQLFLALDDHIDTLSSSSQHWRSLLARNPTLKSMIEKRMRAICDTVDAGDESMYRISHDRLLQVLLAKANRMVARGLPPSLEERYIKTALEVPVMSVLREESSLSGTSSATTSGSPGDDSQTSTSTTLTTPDASVPDAPKPTLETPAEIPHLLRLHTSLTYLSSTYLPSPLRVLTSTHLTTHPTFAPLTSHLASLRALKAEASALRSISDNISRKRGFEEDEEKMAEREEKKRKKEDEEKKKKAEGRAVKQLKKVDTSGMRKMSSFFTKVEKKG